MQLSEPAGHVQLDAQPVPPHGPQVFGPGWQQSVPVHAGMQFAGTHNPAPHIVPAGHGTAGQFVGVQLHVLTPLTYRQKQVFPPVQSGSLPHKAAT